MILMYNIITVLPCFNTAIFPEESEFTEEEATLLLLAIIVIGLYTVPVFPADSAVVVN